MATFRKTLYPAAVQPFGSSSGYPKSGFFAMHFTYPDTEYDDDASDWVYASNPSDVWKQGLTVIVRTNIAYDSAPSETTNVIVVDLKQAKTDAAAAGSSLTFDLGTEEATRLIAAKINDRRLQTTERADANYQGFQARYVKMSGRETYSGTADQYTANNAVTVEFSGDHPFGYPTDLPPTGTITVASTDYSYTKVETFSQTSGTAKARFTISTTPFSPGSASSAAVSVAGDTAKHSVVVSWRGRTLPVSLSNTHSAEATLGPIVQGVGTTVPLWKFIAKPMDGGNMGIPAVNKQTSNGRNVANLGVLGHGYSRFSLEGLNSCYLADMPPPDSTYQKPTVHGTTLAHEDNEDVGGSTTTTFANFHVTTPEYGSDFYGKDQNYSIALESGYTGSPVNVGETHFASGGTLTDIQFDDGAVLHGIQDDNAHAYARPYRMTRTVNSERVRGLTISNEHRVFEPLPVVDDQGNELVLEGGSPFGTVIKDFVIENARTDESTGEEVIGPSDTFGNQTPNLSIQLPASEEIPGDIFVRSAHDRVQAWADKSWGMGGLSIHDDTDKDFDTHDRMLVFHCTRMLHPSLSLVKTSSDITAGAVPSGTTRFFTAHRISDHAERGSVLTQTNNGTATGYPYPHHRIRFGRQGHSFVTPIGHRGTPMHLRRQLHRSFGSSYSLMMEAESEHRHFGFSSPDPSNTTTALYLDTLDVKGVSGYDEATGAFAADNLPAEEITGARQNDQRRAGSAAAAQDAEYVIAPGQIHTAVEGASQSVSKASVSTTTISGTATSTHLTLSTALSFSNRDDVGSEFMMNGFFLDQPVMFGGRPEPPTITKSGSENYFVRGLEEGVFVPKPGTELATVPPLAHHDPEAMNMMDARLFYDASSSWSSSSTSERNLGAFDNRDTNTGAYPDAFLCSWLAEYSHPALFGTSREHYLTFRYRQMGMPKASTARSVRALLLENLSSDVFERLLAIQWLQNYGYNGLNAGGHGSAEGLRAAGAVLMGHSTVREAQGTARLIRATSGPVRYSRAEGIGDAIDPEHDGARVTVDTDATDSSPFTRFFYVESPMVATNVSRRLPVRGWGARSTSSALDMLAGDPTENTTNQQKVLKSGRFDGGIHDSMALIPDATDFGADWMMPNDYEGIERSHPVGFVMSGHTAEATPYHSTLRLSNDPPSEFDRIGIGRRLKVMENGLTSPTALASGAWDVEYVDTRPTALPVTSPVLWLDAGDLDLANGAAVTSWTDRSDNAFEFTQSSASAQPSLIKHQASMNNRPAVDCDGNDSLETAFSSVLNPTEMTVFMVCEVDVDDGNFHGIIESRASTPVARSGFNLYADMATDNQWEFWVGSNTGWTQSFGGANSVVPGEAALVSFAVTGGDGAGGTATLDLRKDGTQLDTDTGAFWKATAGSLNLGLVPSSFFLNGKIAEVIMYDRALTTTERESVESYLSRKYAIGITASAHSGYTADDLDYTTRNKGLDPALDLVQFTGASTYSQTRSAGSVEYASSTFGASSSFFAHGGHVLHTNATPVHYATSQKHYPVNGWGLATTSAGSVTKAAPIPLSEVSESRQVQSRAEPRLGLVIETENQRETNKPRTYGVVGTVAASLHSDLNIGRHFPVLPSWTVNAQFANRGMTTSGGSSAHTIADLDVKPTWSPDSNAAKGAIVASGDSVRFTPKTHAKDAWTVRGSADLPAWGGVYILRKTYLNRDDTDSKRVSLEGTVGHAGQPVRKTVDYIVRLVRPLKMFGYASDLLQDGWLHGARISSADTNDRSSQVMHRDKRYGVFEFNTDRNLGAIDLIASSDGALEIEWPDANEHDVVFHLIPSTAMLQHFKSDAQRKVGDVIRPDIEARYSQSSHPGGGERVHESESRYDANGDGTAGDYMKHTFDPHVIQNDSHGLLRPYFVVRQVITNGLVLDQVPGLPTAGTLGIGGASTWAYTAIQRNVLTGASTPPFSVGDRLVLASNNVFASPVPAAPTFIDNAVIVNRVENGAWWRYDPTEGTVSKTSLSYRGLRPYDPTDFIMASQRPFLVNYSDDSAVVRPTSRSTIQVDGRGISSTFHPPYLFDSEGGRWRVADTEVIQGTTRLILRNGDGVAEQAIAGQHGFVGVRTSDAAMHLLNDAAGEIAGFNIAGTKSLTNFNHKANAAVNAHPVLRQMAEHSPTFTSLEARGLNVLDLFRTLTSIDGRQVVYEGNGLLIYSANVFRNEGARVGMESGALSVSVSRMFDSPNEVIIEGDSVADNEVVFAVVRDTEKMKKAAGADAERNLVRTLRRTIPGLKNSQEALRVAKSLLSRAENGAPLITLQGLLNATSLMPGDVVNVNLPTFGFVGRFAVFEAKHDYTNLRSDIIVAQYEKGVEGLISEIQARIGNASTTEQPSDRDIVVDETTVTGAVRVASIMRVTLRNANQQAFVIGERGHGGIGKIGVRDGSKRGRAIGLSKSKTYEVK